MISKHDNYIIYTYVCIYTRHCTTTTTTHLWRFCFWLWRLTARWWWNDLLTSIFLLLQLIDDKTKYKKNKRENWKCSQPVSRRLGQNELWFWTFITYTEFLFWFRNVVKGKSPLNKFIPCSIPFPSIDMCFVFQIPI